MLPPGLQQQKCVNMNPGYTSRKRRNRNSTGEPRNMPVNAIAYVLELTTDGECVQYSGLPCQIKCANYILCQSFSTNDKSKTP